MQNPKLCKELLQRILPDLEIDHIEYPELQREINPDADAKGVRLDVYIKDNKEVVYNIEMQASDTKGLPQRSRYYQGMMDLQLLDKGDRSYRKLNRSYIIFICTFDLYGKGRHEYMTLLIRDQENLEKGREEGIRKSVKMLKSLHIPYHVIMEQLMQEYLLTRDNAEKYANQE